jgi:hypothetical protein
VWAGREDAACCTSTALVWYAAASFDIPNFRLRPHSWRLHFTARTQAIFQGAFQHAPVGNRWLPRAVLTDSPDQLSLLQAFKVKTPDELADGRHKRRLARIRRLCLGNAKLAEALMSFFTWLTMLPDLVCMILEHLEPIGGITLHSAWLAL